MNFARGFGGVDRSNSKIHSSEEEDGENKGADEDNRFADKSHGSWERISKSDGGR